ncbi:MAG: type II methionyl aminopeptidase [Promethearchaeota archaeon]
MAKKKSSKKTTKKRSAKKTEKVEKEVQKEELSKTELEKSEVKSQKKDETTEEQLTEEEKKKKEEEERIESFKKAGEIAKQVKEFIKPMIKPGAKLLDIVDAAESKIIELGGLTGFPVNICLNHIAAHFTPPPGDNTTIKEGDVVKFDMGVHINGYPVDTAFTVNLNNDSTLNNLVRAAEEAVNIAIELLKPGMKTNHIGRKIEETVKKYGFRTIKDLSGHKIERWNLHAGKSIPCISLPPGSGDEIKEGEVYAVEVFVTNGEGTVHPQQNVQIFSLKPHNIPLRNKKAKKIYNYIINNYKTLPFSRYQIYKQFPREIFGLLEITKSGKIIEHNVLAEKKGRGIFIAQAEETVLVTKDGCQKLT